MSDEYISLTCFKIDTWKLWGKSDFNSWKSEYLMLDSDCNLKIKEINE